MNTGVTPYCRAVASSLPVISAPPSPAKARTCVPGRRRQAATAIGSPAPIAPTTEARNIWPGFISKYRCTKVAKLPASEVTVASSVRCLLISAMTAEKLTPSLVAAHSAFVTRLWTACSPSTQAFRFDALAGAPRASRARTTAAGSHAMPRSGRQTRPTSFGSGQTCTRGSCGSGAAGKVKPCEIVPVMRSPNAISRSDFLISDSVSAWTRLAM